MSKRNYSQFQNLTYKDFKNLAGNKNLTSYEKIGFPDEYRKEFEKNIFNDIISKLNDFNQNNRIIFDIGCGCSDLAHMLIDICEHNNNNLVLTDSEEMLGLLPDKSHIRKIPGRFPDNINRFESYEKKVDAILVYSIMQHFILEMNPYDFIDKALSLLKHGGKLLLGDIPNISKRNRFFSSEKGIKCHQEFTKSDKMPTVEVYKIQENKIDDGMIFGILQRYRGFGYETYILPQPDNLPIFTRREDVLIVKP